MGRLGDVELFVFGVVALQLERLRTVQADVDARFGVRVRRRVATEVFARWKQQLALATLVQLKHQQSVFNRTVMH